MPIFAQYPICHALLKSTSLEEVHASFDGSSAFRRLVEDLASKSQIKRLVADEPEPEPYELSEAGEAGVTVAESHADWRIFADLFAERCAVIGVCATSGDGAGASEPCEGGPVTIFSASKVDERSAELFIVELCMAELLGGPLTTMRLEKSEGRRI